MTYLCLKLHLFDDPYFRANFSGFLHLSEIGIYLLRQKTLGSSEVSGG